MTLTQGKKSPVSMEKISLARTIVCVNVKLVKGNSESVQMCIWKLQAYIFTLSIFFFTLKLVCLSNYSKVFNPELLRFIKFILYIKRGE